MKATRRTIVVDAAGQPLGRIATRVAYVLQGKHLAKHRSNDVPAVIVTVKNTEKVFISKKKLRQKKYYRTSGYPGAVKTELLRDAVNKSPKDVLRRTVRGMLPTNKHRDAYLQNLHFA